MRWFWRLRNRKPIFLIILADETVNLEAFRFPKEQRGLMIVRNVGMFVDSQATIGLLSKGGVITHGTRDPNLEVFPVFGRSDNTLEDITGTIREAGYRVRFYAVGKEEEARLFDKV